MAAKSKPKAKKPAAKKAAPKAVESPGNYESVSVRKISNGFVVSKSCEKRGKYTTKETYSKTNPLSGIGE